MPIQEFASSNLAQVRYIEETEYGVTPTTGNPSNLRMTGESLAFSITKTESGEITPDRQTADLIETGASAGGGVNLELSYREFDTLFRAMLMAQGWEAYGTNGVGDTFQATTTTSTVVATAAPTGASAFNTLRPGQWFQLQCPGNINHRKFLKVHASTAPTGTTLTVDPATPLVADGTAKAAKLSSSRISNGVTKKSFTFERAHNDVQQFFPFTGMVPSKLSLSMASGSILTGSMEFMGKAGGRKNTTSLPGTPIPSQSFDVMNAVSGLGQLLEGGVAMTNTKIKKLDLTIDNTLRGQDAIGERGNANIGLGTVKVTGTMEVYLADGSMYDKFLNNTRTSLQFVLCDGNKNGYAFTIAAMKFGDAKVQAGSKDSDCMLSIPFTGIRDTVTGKTIIMDRMGLASDQVELPSYTKAEINTSPSVNGTPQVGTPLSITSGTFRNDNPQATVVRTIYAGNTLVATAAGYTPTAADVGKRFTVVDTATNTAGSTANMSDNSAVCIAAAVTEPAAFARKVMGVSMPFGDLQSGALTANSSWRTVRRFPQAFKRLRCYLFNNDTANAMTGAKACWSPSESLANGSRPTIGGAVNNSSSYRFLFGGQLTTTLPVSPGDSIPSVTVSDWLDTPSIATTDGNPYPIGYFTTLFTSGAQIGYSAPGNPFQSYLAGLAGTKHAYRVHMNNGDCVENPALFTENATSQFCVPMLIEVEYITGARTIIACGDSTLQGAGNTANAGAALMALAQLDAAGMPADACILAESGLQARRQDLRLRNVVAKHTPDTIYFQVFSVNDSSNYFGSSAATIARVDYWIDWCATNGVNLILDTPLPIVAKGGTAVSGSNLTALTDMTTYILSKASARVKVLDLTPLHSAQYSGVWSATYGFDGYHPNPSGHQLRADLLTAAIKSFG